MEMILWNLCWWHRLTSNVDYVRDFHPSREFISLLFRDVAQVIYELFGTRTHARIVLNIHRASWGVEASRVPGIHHPFKRAAEGRESRFAKRCQNVDEVTCEVEETSVDRRARLRKFCSVIISLQGCIAFFQNFRSKISGTVWGMTEIQLLLSYSGY